MKNRLQDDNNNVVEKFRSVSFTYQKDNDEVIFSQEKFNSEVAPFGENIAEDRKSTRLNSSHP